jgi:DNA-binding MarR family transcriptional regulator
VTQIAICEENTIGYLLQHLAMMLHRQCDQMLQERLGIGMAQYRILTMLQMRPGAQQRKVADCLGQTEASVSRQVKVLHDKGMLVTRVNPKERREHITELTSKGVKLCETACEALADYYKPMLDEFGEKQRQALIETLSAVHHHICQPGRLAACDHPLNV